MLSENKCVPKTHTRLSCRRDLLGKQTNYVKSLTYVHEMTCYTSTEAVEMFIDETAVKRSDVSNQETDTKGEWLERPVHEAVGTGALLEGLFCK